MEQPACNAERAQEGRLLSARRRRRRQARARVQAAVPHRQQSTDHVDRPKRVLLAWVAASHGALRKHRTAALAKLFVRCARHRNCAQEASWRRILRDPAVFLRVTARIPQFT